LLSRFFESGLLSDEQAFDDEIIAALPKESLEELRIIHKEILRKRDPTTSQ